MKSPYFTMSSGVHFSDFISGTIPFIAAECAKQNKCYLTSPKRDIFSFFSPGSNTHGLKSILFFNMQLF